MRPASLHTLLSSRFASPKSAKSLAASACIFLATFAALSAPPLAAQTMITILNPSFEMPTPSSFPDYTVGATEWTRTRTDTDAGTFNPTTPNPDVTPGPIDGNQVGYANGSGGLQQLLATTYQANFTYTFSVSIAIRSDDLTYTTGTGAISIGTFDNDIFTTLGSQSMTVGQGTFSTVEGTYLSSAGVAGQTIALRITNPGAAQIVFDVVTLSAVATPVPEPATTAALLALAALVATRLRRRRIIP